MQNDECKMQNDCVAFGDNLKIFSKKIPQFCILHFAHQRDELKFEAASSVMDDFIV